MLLSEKYKWFFSTKTRNESSTLQYHGGWQCQEHSMFTKNWYNTSSPISSTEAFTDGGCFASWW